MKKAYNVWIIGAGGIGSRHLQALKKVKLPLNITVVDPSSKSLAAAKERYDSAPKRLLRHKTEYLSKIPDRRNNIDVAIIATCSDVRANIIKELAGYNKIKYLILEKILFNNKQSYSEIGKILKNKGIKTWANCPMRMMPAYQNIEKHFKNKRISYTVTGSQFGLISSAVHYLDHSAYLSGKTGFKINTTGLEPRPIPSKRNGFIELNGTLTAHFENGSNVSLTCYPDGNSPFVVEINSNNAKYIGRESEGKAWLATSDNNWQWEELEAPIPFQSQLTTTLVEKILKTGKCDLTQYNESEKIHLNLLKPLHSFLNRATKKNHASALFT